MWRRFHQDRRLLWTMLALSAIAGLDALATLPRMEDPRFSSRYEYVVTEWPGASAERVEALLTDRIEDALIGMREIHWISSESRAGVSSVFVALDNDIAGDAATDDAWSRVRDRLSHVAPTLPEGAGTPVLSDREVFANTLLVAVTWDRSDAPANEAILGRRARMLEERLRAVPGAESTRLFGLAPEEVRVDVDPAQLAALGLTVADIADRLEGRDAKRAAGQLEVGGARLLLEVEGAPERLGDLLRAPIAVGADGRSILLQEVAGVTKTVDHERADAALVDGRRAVVVAVRMAADRRIDRFTRATRGVLAEFEATLSPGLRVDVLFDQSRYTATRLGDLRDNFLLGVAAVMLTTLLLMGWRSALLAGMVLPLVVLIVLAGMKALEVPIEQMSITGLIVALGILIDNIVVMVDETRHRLAEGVGAGAAVQRSLERLAVPLVGSTLTTVLGFMPIVSMSGPTGEFVRSIGLCVVLAVVASLALTLAAVPALTVALAAVGPEARSWLDRGAGWPRLYATYRRLLDVLLARPRAALALAVTGPALGFIAATELPEQFFPSAERDVFQVQLRLPEASSLDVTLAAAEEARQVLLALDEVTAVHWFAGSAAPPFYYNMPGGEDGSPNFAQALVERRTSRGMRETVQAAQRALDRALPGVQALALELAQGPAVVAPIVLRITGPDLETLAAEGRKARSLLAGVPGVIHTRATLSAGRPAARVRLDDDAVRRAGLDNERVAGLLDAAYSGVSAGSLLEGSEELPVRVRRASAGAALSDAASLDLEFRGARPDGGLGSVPLDGVGALVFEPTWASIPRRDGGRVNEVMGFVEAGLLPAVVEARFRERLAEAQFSLPSGYRLEFAGEGMERDDAVSSLLGSVAVLLVLIVAALILATGSFRLAALVLVVGLLSIGLGLGALYVTGYPFGFMAILGLLGLVGIAINDAIVVLSLLRGDERARAGDVVAVREVVFRTTRHVLTTTLTTTAGFLPLWIAGGDFWPPLAVAIAGGVAGATLLALTLVPTVFLAIARTGRPLAAPRTASASALVAG